MPTARQLMLRLVLFTQVPAYLAIGSLLALHHGSERERVSAGLVAHARALAFALDERMLSVQHQLEGLAARVPASTDGLPAFRRDAMLVQQLAGADRIVLATAAGRALVDTRSSASPVPVQLPDPMLRLLRAGAVSYSVQGTGGGSAGWPQAAVTVPVRRGRDLHFALIAGLQRSRFQTLLAGQSLPDGWIASIVDDRGVIMARLPNPEQLVGRSVRASLQQAIARSNGGAFEADTLDGIPVVTAYSRSPVHGWTAMVAVPRRQLYAPLQRNAAYQALTAVVLLTVTMLLSLRISRRFIGALDHLQAEADCVAAGEAVQPQVLGFAEARRIGERLQFTGEAARRARVRLSDSEQRLCAILQTATDAVVVSDDRWHVVLMNEAALRLFGSAVDGARKRGLQLLIAPATWAHFLDLSRRRAQGPIPPDELVALRGQGRRADGTLFPMEYSLSHFVDGKGEAFCTMFARDITRRLQGEASLIATRSELRRMNTDFQNALLRETASRQAAVARELHDAVGSSLAGLSMLLGSARAHAREPEAAVLIGKSQEQVARAARQVRQISRSMMPAGQDGGALLPALQHFASETCELPGVSCRFCSRGNFDALTAEAGGHLYRIVQEACSNALRHGGASHLHVMLARVGDCCRLTIRDNGSGCEIANLDAPAVGIGVRSMRARAEAIGGLLDIVRRPAGGLAVQVAWSSRAGADAVPARVALGDSVSNYSRPPLA